MKSYDDKNYVKNHCENVNISTASNCKTRFLGEIFSNDDPVRFTFTLLDLNNNPVNLNVNRLDVLISYNYNGEPYILRDTAEVIGNIVVYNFDNNLIVRDFSGNISMSLLLNNDKSKINIGEYKIKRTLSIADTASQNVSVNNVTFVNYDDMLQDAIEQIKEDISSGIVSIPIASKESLGVVKVGEGLTIADDGLLSADVRLDSLKFTIEDDGCLYLSIND